MRQVKKTSSSVGLGGSDSGKLADPEERNLGELAGTELFKRSLLRRVLEVPVEGLDVFDIVRYPVDNRALRQINVFSG